MESTVLVTIATTILFTAAPTAVALYLWLANSRKKQ